MKFCNNLIRVSLAAAALCMCGCDKSAPETPSAKQQDRPATQNAQTAKAITINDLKIVPKDNSGDIRSLYFSKQEIEQDSFKQAGEDYQKYGAVNPNATIAEQKGKKFSFLLDARRPDDRTPNTLRINLDGGTDFTESIPVDLSFDIPSSTIEKTIIETEIDSLPAKISVYGSYLDYRRYGSDYRYLQVAMDSAIEGFFTLDGQKYCLNITDRGSNLKYTDSYNLGYFKNAYFVSGKGHVPLPSDFSVTDTISLYEVDAANNRKLIYEGYYGTPMAIGSCGYKAIYSPEGNSISLTPDTSGFGEAKLKHTGTKVILHESTRTDKYGKMLYLSGSSTANVPAGAYQIYCYEISGNKWKISSYFEKTSRVIDIRPNRQTLVDFALPLKPRINIEKRSNRLYRLTPELLDNDFRPVSLIYQKINTPINFRIKDSEGKIVHCGRFEYGWGDSLCSYTWRVPKQLSGTFTAEVILPDVFESEAVKADITVR